MKGKKPQLDEMIERFNTSEELVIKSRQPTSRRKKSRKWGAPMVATGNRGIPHTYPTGNSEDY